MSIRLRRNNVNIPTGNSLCFSRVDLVMKKWQLIVIAVFLVGLAVAAPFYGSMLNQQTSQNGLGVGSASATSTGNTIQAYLKIDTIDGDSTSAQHSRTIELVDFNWTEAMPLNTATRSSSLTQCGDFRFTAQCSSASPKLFLACAKQTPISTAVLYVQRSSNGQTKDLLVWSLQNVVVGSYSNSLCSSDGLVIDTFSLYFGKAMEKYYPINPDGSYGSPVETSYDFQSGKPA
jgi:type VI secretion system secreted protein Hcp